MRSFAVRPLALALLVVCALASRADAAVLSVDARAQPASPETGYFHFGTATAPDGETIGINSRYLTLDGKPWLPVMGEFHFTRFPNRYWEQELAKMKTAGVGIVSTYIFWNHHEEHEGQFNWTGDRDLRRFITLCRELGLKVVIRPGPWVHSEARFGGIPDWVVHAMPTRSNDPGYLRYVARFWGQVAGQLKGLLWKDGGPVIGMQIENEYNLSGPGQGREHIAALKEIARKAGLDVPLYTVTGWDNTLFPEHEVTPLEGGYADQPWGLSATKMAPAETYAFRFKSRVAGNLGAETTGAFMGDATTDTAHTPFLGTEFGGGVPAMYRRRPIMQADDVASMLPVELGSGVNLYGYYMFHGGQNSPDHGSLEENTAIGAYNDLPMIDYDFQAPLGAYGQEHASLGRIRPIHYFLDAFGAALAPMTAHAPDVLPKDSADLATPRFSVRSLGDSGFLFVSNYVRQYPMAVQKEVRFSVGLPGGTLAFPRKPVDIPSGAYFIWPINLDLSGVTLSYATAQPVTRIEDGDGPVYVFRAEDGVPVELAFASDGIAKVHPPSGQVDGDATRLFVSGIHPGTDAVMDIFKRGGGRVRILVLDARQADRMSVATFGGARHLVISDAQFYQDRDALTFLSAGEPRIAFSMFPAPKPDLPLKAAGADGVFLRYEATTAAHAIPVSVAKVRDAGEVPPLRITGPGNTAVEPVPEVFGRSAAWTIALPKGALDGVEDAFLRIDARGDVGRLFAGLTMIDDQFLNGSTWEIGLKRFAGSLDKPLTLTILPMRGDAAIYLDKGVAAMVSGAQTASVDAVTVVPQYALRIDTAPKPKKK